jgi:hypothetical protein
MYGKLGLDMTKDIIIAMQNGKRMN